MPYRYTKGAGLKKYEAEESPEAEAQEEKVEDEPKAEEARKRPGRRPKEHKEGEGDNGEDQASS